MTARILSLDEDDLWCLAEELDVVTTLHEALTAPRDSPGELVRLTADVEAFHDPHTGDRCEFPAAGLRALRAAGLVAVAARSLLTPGVVTAGLVGAGPAALWHLAVLCRSVPGVSHVAVYAEGQPMTLRVLDQLELTGIGLSVSPSAADAAFGATLVVAFGGAVAQIPPHRLARGALVVNAGPQPAPAQILEAVDRICPLDDLVRAPAGVQPPRINPEDILLVEPLAAALLVHLDAVLAHRLATAALHRGVGVLLSG